MKLFFGTGEHPSYGGHYEVIIAANDKTEALAVLQDYQRDEYVGVEITLHGDGIEVPAQPKVISFSESGV